MDGKVLDGHDRVGAAEKRASRLDDDVGGGGRELGPHRNLGDFLHDLRDDGNLLLILADVRSHVLSVHVRAGEVQLERVGAFVLTGLGQILPVRELTIAAGARP